MSFHVLVMSAAAQYKIHRVEVGYQNTWGRLVEKLKAKGWFQPEDNVQLLNRLDGHSELDLAAVIMDDEATRKQLAGENGGILARVSPEPVTDASFVHTVL